MTRFAALMTIGALLVGLAAVAIHLGLTEPDPPAPDRQIVELEADVAELRADARHTYAAAIRLREVLGRQHDRITRLRTRLERLAQDLSSRPPTTPDPSGPTVTVEATAYCLTGTMASGEPVYEGAVAANVWDLGTRLYIAELGGTYTVADRIGAGSELDIAMPGRCDDAIAFGRRTLTVTILD